MIGKKGTLIMILLFLTATPALQAQQAPPTKEEVMRRIGTPSAPQTTDSPQPASFYRLDFAIREMEGEKLLDTRRYSLWLQTGSTKTVTAGSEVPYTSAVYASKGAEPVKSISYRNVGVQISCSVKEIDGNPRLNLSLTISDAPPAEKDNDKPVTRKISIDSEALLAPGKPTTVSIVEDPGSRHRFQVDVTATKLK